MAKNNPRPNCEIRTPYWFTTNTRSVLPITNIRLGHEHLLQLITNWLVTVLSGDNPAAFMAFINGHTLAALFKLGGLLAVMYLAVHFVCMDSMGKIQQKCVICLKNSMEYGRRLEEKEDMVEGGPNATVTLDSQRDSPLLGMLDLRSTMLM